MYRQEYKCTKCGLITKRYVWTSELETATHKCDCGEVLTVENIYDAPVIETFRIGTKMTKEQIKAERTIRSKKHFKTEVLPTLSGKDQRYFNSKNRNNKN